MNEKDRVDQIAPKLTAKQSHALWLVSCSRVHEVPNSTWRYLSRMDLIRVSGVHGAGKPTSGWCTALGDAVLARLAGETHG